MGRLKDEIMERDEAWLSKARAMGWKCLVCGETPPYGERDTFFRTNRCGACARNAERDD